MTMNLDAPYEGALTRFAPLIATLQSQLPTGYDFAVENTGGHIYCLFVRNMLTVVARDMDRDVNAYRRERGLPIAPDRCVVFSDELDAREPDPTAPSAYFPASFARYRDWNDPNDTADGEMYFADGRNGEPDIEARTLFVALIAVWAAPRIREWLSRPEDTNVVAGSTPMPD